MSSRSRAYALSCGLLIATSLGCAGEDGGPPDEFVPPDSDAGTTHRCVDEDGDGYVVGCTSVRRDSDDADPEVTDLCWRCAEPNEGCPCEPGTEFESCDPRDVRGEHEGKVGVWVCDEGQRWCRDGAWTDCEILWQYATFMEER
jgi:hypothetical protein